MNVISINAGTREVVIKTGKEHYNLYELDLLNVIDTHELDKIVHYAFSAASDIESAEVILREKGIVLRLIRED